MRPEGRGDFRNEGESVPRITLRVDPTTTRSDASTLAMTGATVDGTCVSRSPPGSSTLPLDSS